MPTLPVFRLTAVLMPLALFGCADEPVDLQPSIAIVYGNVLSTDQQPVSAASVLIYAVPLERCGEQEGWLARTTTTDAAGTYRAVGTYVHVGRETMCLAVRVRPPAASSLEEMVVAGDTVTFTHESLTPPIDSVRVDVVLPAGA